MKIPPEKLVSQLSRSVSPIYIVSGDEPLLVQETCDSLRAVLREKGYTERQLYHVDGNFKWETLLFDANSMSLFADMKLLELRMPTGKPGDKGAALLTYAENPSEENVLLLVTERLDAATQRSKWYTALEKIGVAVQIWPIDAPALPGWIRRRAQQVGLNLDAESAQALADKVEGNLLAASQEIDLLRLACKEGKPTLEQVVAGVSDSTRYSIFSLIDEALAGHTRKTVLMAQGLRTEGAEPLQILALLVKELRAGASMAGMIRTGTPIDAAMNNLRVWQKRKPLIRKALGRHSLTEFQQMIVQAGRVDQMVKGLQLGDPWDELTTLFINLSGAKLSTLAN